MYPFDYFGIISSKAQDIYIKPPSNDDEYIALRNKRNSSTEQIERNYTRGSVKHYDVALEVYEKKHGTDYCEALFRGCLEEFITAEWDKCKNDPVYCFNRYMRQEGEREITQDEYDTAIAQSMYLRMRPSRSNSKLYEKCLKMAKDMPTIK